MSLSARARVLPERIPGKRKLKRENWMVDWRMRRERRPPSVSVRYKTLKKLVGFGEEVVVMVVGVGGVIGG